MSFLQSFTFSLNVHQYNVQWLLGGMGMANIVSKKFVCTVQGQVGVQFKYRLVYSSSTGWCTVQVQVGVQSGV